MLPTFSLFYEVLCIHGMLVVIISPLFFFNKVMIIWEKINCIATYMYLEAYVSCV